MHLTRRQLISLATLVALITLLAPPGMDANYATIAASAPLGPAATTVRLIPTDDAATAAASPAVNAGSGPLIFVTPNSHHNFVRFDLSALPATATIDSAELQLNIMQVSGGPRDIEIGRTDGAWDEGVITWSTKPGVTWSGVTQTASAPGVVAWNVKPLVAAWQAGAANHGFALRGAGGGANAAAASSKETGIAPKLVVTYSTPADNQPMPDLGDAPDSTNSAGAAMQAYAGVPANFPTVWASTPAGQPAGPRHANQTYEGMLGDALSRELEADAGLDQDGVNNIRPAAGDANNDRADDGWRNPTATFAACQRTTLLVRVTRLPAARLDRMVLNVWFDGNRDGDWADVTNCNEDGIAVPGHEWIVQDFPVNMGAIAPGGFADIYIGTERVLNTAAGAHWLRFSLSEARSVKNAAGLADGRGPSSPASFSHGETEDYLQRPQPAGEDGTLTLTKTSSYAGGVVPTNGVLTFDIKLRHAGGSQPVQAGIRDLIPYPLSLLQLPGPQGPTEALVLAPFGGVSPLAARTQIQRSPPGTLVTWAGTLAPNSEVVLRLMAQIVAYCPPGQQTTTITNTARAAKQGGAILTAELPFTAACATFDEEDVEVEQTVEPGDGARLSGPDVDLPDMREVKAGVQVTNKRADPVSVALFAESDGATAAAPDPSRRKIIGRVSLGPGETTSLNSAIKFDGVDGEAVADLTQAGALSFTSRLGYCFLSDPDADCPDEVLYPQMVGYANPITVTVKPHDLGDAPDSSNHAGVQMLAYPGVPARYPTVFDPATGLPQGPSHSKPLPFHLGQRVSLEVEADQGLDQDPANNIVPAANTPNRDRADDGANPSAWPLAACQTAVVPVRVFVSPAAAAWFTAQNAPGYLNIWLDGNRDGDWADGANCPNGGVAVEHLVIDYPVNVTALGAGLHTINVPTGLAPWPANQASQPAWVRVTLSEAKSAKPLTFGGVTYGDGRGPAQGFRTGETEDYILRRDGVQGAGPDIQLEMKAASQRRAPQGDGMLVGAASMGEPMDFSFDLSAFNLGTRTATGGELTFTIPPGLRGLPVRVRSGQGSGDAIPTESLSLNFEEIKVQLRNIQPGGRNSIVLGWYGCITCTVAAAAVQDYTARARITLADDADPSNNEASATARSEPIQPTIGQFPETGDPVIDAADYLIWRSAVTSRTAPLLGGRAQPGSTVAILVDGQQVGTATAGADGVFKFRASLAAGAHRIYAGYPAQVQASELGNFEIQMLRLTVNPNLPFDPATLTVTDGEGRIYSNNMGGGLLGLMAGKRYTVGVNASAQSSYFKATFSDILISSVIGGPVELTDPDGDGRYAGAFTYSGAATAAAGMAAAPQAHLLVWDGVVERDYPFELQPLPQPVVRDARTKQPLSGVRVNLLQKFTPPGRASYFVGVGADTTGPDGAYAFSVGEGAYRLEASKVGYQTYRSPSFDVDGIWLGRDILLMPTLAAAAATASAPVYQVHMTRDGYELPELAVRTGSVVAFINLDLDEHTATGAGWDSGVLGPGESFSILADANGAFPYQDEVGRLSRGRIVVGPNAPLPGRHTWLPLTLR